MISLAAAENHISFIPAKYFRKGRRVAPRCIVLHTTECKELVGNALVVARLFERGEIEASAHVIHDAETTVHCVRFEDTAFHTRSNDDVMINDWSIGVEHVGFANQTAAQWKDEFSTKLLRRSAGHTAWLCRRFGVPPVRLNEDQVRQQLPGITGHGVVSRAFSVKGGHVDPGPHFPWMEYMRLVAEAW